MKHYKDTATGTVYGYEDDGSQDHLISPTCVLLTDAEFEQFKQEIEIKSRKAFADAQENISPTEKLQNFLNANPDVLDLITKGTSNG